MTKKQGWAVIFILCFISAHGAEKEYISLMWMVAGAIHLLPLFFDKD